MLLQDIRKIACFFCLILLIIFPFQLFTAKIAQELVWNVQVGDSHTYLYTKFFNSTSPNPNQSFFTITSDKGEEVTIVVKEGLRLRYTITFIRTDQVIGKITYNDTVTSRESEFGWDGVLQPTIKNKTYWEEWCKYRGEYNVTGNLLIEEFLIQNTPISNGFQYIYKWNWQTGWMSYRYFKTWNETTTISENEIIEVTNNSSQSNHIIFSVCLLGVIVMILVTVTIYYRYKQ